MAGIARIVIGILLILIGLPFLLLFFVGLIPIILGIILVASGASARGDEQRMIAQQKQTNLLLQQQLQMNAMQANRAPVARYQVEAPGPATGASPVAGSGFCPYCGFPVAAGTTFCAKCGKPLAR
jgi:uncharacterized membrane protein